MEGNYRVEWRYGDDVEVYRFRTERQARVFFTVTVWLDRVLRRFGR